MRNVATKFVEEETHFNFHNFFFRKLCHLWDNVEKYCRAGQAIDGNTEHAHCMLDTLGYKHTVRISNS
jgi:hypothetical protein